MSFLRRYALSVIATLLLPGCFATTKHLETVEQGVASRSAWTDERMEQLDAKIDEVRAENEALRVRMDDLADQLSGLGTEISNRLADLTEQNTVVQRQAQEAARSADDIEEKRAIDRDDLLSRLNTVVEEVSRENDALRERIDTLENSAFTFGRLHKVKKGESVASIASLYGVAANDIIEANGLPNGNLIHVGQELVVPGASK